MVSAFLCNGLQRDLRDYDAIVTSGASVTNKAPSISRRSRSQSMIIIIIKIKL